MPVALKTWVCATALSIAALTAQARTAVPDAASATPRVDARQAQQRARIAQGVASGELTPLEQRRLNQEQRAIRHATAQAKADGVVTPRERRRLERMQDRASRHIQRQKHDRQTARFRAAGALR